MSDRFFKRGLLSFFLLWLWPVSAFTQEVTPIRTGLARDALQAVEWRMLEPGLAVKRAENSGIRLTVLSIDLTRYHLSIAVQNNPDGERAESFGKRHDATIAMNGGFFGEKQAGKNLFPVGLLRISGKNISTPWRFDGGYLVLGREVKIFPTMQGLPDGRFADVVQSKPVLIETGGKWAMNTNRQNLRRRTIICLPDDDSLVVAMITGTGMSLYEAGWLMRKPVEGGLFGCDSAIALDGGGSTQLWLRNYPQFEIRGETPVHNALLIKRSAAE
jgi:exopolysaccharide biosynthesis protein